MQGSNGDTDIENRLVDTVGLQWREIKAERNKTVHVAVRVGRGRSNMSYTWMQSYVVKVY